MSKPFDWSRYSRPLVNPWAILAEALLLPVLAVAIGIWLNPLDPLWTNGPFPWAWLAPMLLALRYGPVPGLLGTGVLLAAWLILSFSGLITGQFPEINFLGGLIVVMLCGEFSSLSMARARRAEGVQVYLDHRLDYLTHQYYLLRLSHDRLEQDLLSRPISMRDALSTINAPSAVAQNSEALPGAAALLRLLAQYCQLECAGLFVLRDGALDTRPVATLGELSPLAPDDALIRHAIENKVLTHIAKTLTEGEKASRYVIAAPLSSFDEEMHALLVVEKLPFFALNDETLQTINLLLGYFTDGLARDRASADIRARVPACPVEFAFELQRVWRLRQQAGVSSVIVALALPSGPRMEALAQQIVRQKRGLDNLWAIESASRRVLATLMPFSGDAAAEGYVARIESWVRQQHAQTLSEAGIFTHILTIESTPPVELLAQLFDSCHVSSEVRPLGADA